MARWDDDRRRTGEQAARGDDRWAGQGEPWPGRGQLRNRDDEGGESREWEVRPRERAWRSDARIHEDLAERLAASNVNTEDVELSVEDGVVTLSGRVDERWDERSLAEMAQDTFGVTEVENRLRIDSPMDRARRANRVGDDTHEDLHQ